MEEIPEVHLQRIESGSTGLGIPDVNYCYKGTEGWAELKVAKVTKKTPHRVTLGLRPAQARWLHKRWSAGGLAWCVALLEDKVAMFPGRQCLNLLALDSNLLLTDIDEYAALYLPKYDVARIVKRLVY